MKPNNFKYIDFYYYNQGIEEMVVVDFEGGYITITEYFDEDNEKYDLIKANYTLFIGDFKDWEKGQSLNEDKVFWQEVSKDMDSFMHNIIFTIFGF